jgi:hypothetical protein
VERVAGVTAPGAGRGVTAPCRGVGLGRWDGVGKHAFAALDGIRRKQQPQGWWVTPQQASMQGGLQAGVVGSRAQHVEWGSVEQGAACRGVVLCREQGCRAGMIPEGVVTNLWGC